jgi:hypothetical protein
MDEPDWHRCPALCPPDDMSFVLQDGTPVCSVLDVGSVCVPLFVPPPRRATRELIVLNACGPQNLEVALPTAPLTMNDFPRNTKSVMHLVDMRHNSVPPGTICLFPSRVSYRGDGSALPPPPGLPSSK